MLAYRKLWHTHSKPRYACYWHVLHYDDNLSFTSIPGMLDSFETQLSERHGLQGVSRGCYSIRSLVSKALSVSASGGGTCEW